MRVVCISGKAQAGKDTTAVYLKEFLESNGKRVLIAHFGDLLKYVCRQFFGWDGKKDEKGRSLLQYVGTEKVRATLPHFWSDFVFCMLRIFEAEWDYVLLADCRFPSEYESAKDFQSVANSQVDVALLRVDRPNFRSPLTPEQQRHISEIAMDDYLYDYHIVNSGNLEDLRKSAYTIATAWLRK